MNNIEIVWWNFVNGKEYHNEHYFLDVIMRKENKFYHYSDFSIHSVFICFLTSPQHNLNINSSLWKTLEIRSNYKAKKKMKLSEIIKMYPSLEEKYKNLYRLEKLNESIDQDKYWENVLFFYISKVLDGYMKGIDAKTLHLIYHTFF
jgi:hypothetical protein